jgi:hypothetical protein
MQTYQHASGIGYAITTLQFVIVVTKARRECRSCLLQMGGAETLPERIGSGQGPHMTAPDPSILSQMTSGSAVGKSTAPPAHDKLKSEVIPPAWRFAACFQTTE